MATITEDYCSFELSKLLKRKGFDEPCYQYYMVTKTLHVTFHKRVHVEEEPFFNSTGKNGVYEESDKTLFDDVFSAPSLSLVCKWLRVKYNLNVEVYRTACGYIGCIVAIPSGTDIKFLEENSDDKASGQYTKPELATENAIKYCLEYLI